jgi:histidine triad (HIT) family protein
MRAFGSVRILEMGSTLRARSPLLARTPMDCIFCAIVAGRAPCFRIYEDERVLVFLDIFPNSPGHTLLIPKAHAENLYESEPDDLAAVVRTSKRIAQTLRRELEFDGLSVVQLNGAAAGQTVFHYHMHLIPRKQGQSMQIHSRVRGNDAELARMAERLRSSLENDGAGATESARVSA